MDQFDMRELERSGDGGGRIPHLQAIVFFLFLLGIIANSIVQHATASAHGWSPTNTEIEEHQGLVSIFDASIFCSSQPDRFSGMMNANILSEFSVLESASPTETPRGFELVNMPTPEIEYDFPYVTGNLLMSHPAALSAAAIWSASELLSKLEETENTAALCFVSVPSNFAHLDIFDAMARNWSLENRLGANFSSIFTLARRSPSAILLASAAASSAFAARSFPSARSRFKYPSLAFPIQIMNTVATTPNTRPRSNIQLAMSYKNEAVSLDGHIRIPPLVPIVAIIIVVMVGGIGIILQMIKIYSNLKRRSKSDRRR